jgi:protein SCO1/2
MRAKWCLANLAPATHEGCLALQRRTSFRLVLALLSLLGIVFVTTLVLNHNRKIAPLPSAIGGPFALVATDGKIVTQQNFHGKWALIYFGYTFCPDACPTALSDMTLALQKLGPASAQIQPLFITIDPKRDTGAALSDYLKAFDPRIVGLTGSEAQTSAAAAAYHVYAKPQTDAGTDYLIDHSAYVYVMDPEGRFVDVVDGATPGDEMSAAIQKMMDHYL